MLILITFSLVYDGHRSVPDIYMIFLCTLQSPNAAVACPSMRRSLAPPKIACKKPDTDSVFIRVPIRNPGLGSTTSPNSKHPSGTDVKLTPSLLSLWFILILSLWRSSDFLWFAVGRFKLNIGSNRVHTFFLLVNATTLHFVFEIANFDFVSTHTLEKRPGWISFCRDLIT